jgi:hypothetical protein
LHISPRFRKSPSRKGFLSACKCKEARAAGLDVFLNRGKVIDLFSGSGGLRVGLLEVAVARRSGVRKATLPRVSLGLGNILAQSGVVANAFGRWPGFVLMVLALMVALAVGLVTAGVLIREIIHAF